LVVVGEDHLLEAMAAAAAAGKQVKKRQEAAAKWAEEEAYLNTVRAHPFTAVLTRCLCSHPTFLFWTKGVGDKGKPAFVPFLPKSAQARCDCTSEGKMAIVLSLCVLVLGRLAALIMLAHAMALLLDSTEDFFPLALVSHTIHLSRLPHRIGPLCLDAIGHSCSS
jgi:hypothetical protein